MKGIIQNGVIKGAGAAVNVPCGFVPSFVLLNNARGAVKTITVWNGYPVLGFDSGSYEILPGDKLTATAGGSFEVHSVTVLSGSWAGGDAAGFLEIRGDTGTISDNNTLDVAVTDGRAAFTNAATVDGTRVYFDADIDSEVGIPSTRFVTAFEGVPGETPKGFTLSAGSLPSGEYVRWTAFASDH